MVYYMCNFIAVNNGSCQFCKHFVVVCLTYNLELDKHLPIYGTAAKILFALVHKQTDIV